MVEGLVGSWHLGGVADLWGCVGSGTREPYLFFAYGRGTGHERPERDVLRVQPKWANVEGWHEVGLPRIDWHAGAVGRGEEGVGIRCGGMVV
jgi:hypothetical protein